MILLKHVFKLSCSQTDTQAQTDSHEYSIQIATNTW